MEEKSKYYFTGMLCIMIVTAQALAKEKYYPIKRETVSLSNFIATIKEQKLNNEEKLAKAFGSIKSDPKAAEKKDGILLSRYLYSPSWGWIDLKHFAAAAYQTSLWYLGSVDVLLLGELNEIYQSYQKGGSAFSYEDFVSNMLGAYFEDIYINEKENKKKNFLTNVEEYLRALQFVEDPLLAAPNARDIPRDYDLKSDEIARNKTYIPFYTKKAANTLLDRKIKLYRKLIIGY